MHKHSNTLLSFYALVSFCSLHMYQVSFLDVFFFIFLFFRVKFCSFDKSVLSLVCSDKLLCDAFWNQNHFAFLALFSYMSNSMDLFICSCPLDMVKTRTHEHSNWICCSDSFLFLAFWLHFFFPALRIHFGSWSWTRSNESRKYRFFEESLVSGQWIEIGIWYSHQSLNDR